MDPLRNPYAPGAGSPPPELVGRESLIELTKIKIGRTQRRLHAKSVLVTGLRGVGKTVLLYRIRTLAEDAGCQTALTEARQDGTFLKILARELQPMLVIARRTPSTIAKRALAVFKSFSIGVGLDGNVTFGLDVDVPHENADTGDTDVDLRRLFLALGELALERKTALVLGIDELQYLSRNELGSVISATQAVDARALPVAVFGAGLPNLPVLATQARTYAERLFNFPEIGALTTDEVRQAVEEPAVRLGVAFDADASAEIARMTEGYPYFVQEWAHDTWNAAHDERITVADVESATATVRQRLERDFFRVRLERLTPREMRYVSALASLGPGSHRTGDIANVLGASATSIASTRDALVGKGTIYSPGYGEAAFTAPLFDAYLREHTNASSTNPR